MLSGLKREAADPDGDASGRATIGFMSREGFPTSDPPVRTFFESLPLLRNVRKLVTSSRALGADDYMLPSEGTTDPNAGKNPKRWNLSALKQALDDAAASLKLTLNDLGVLITSIPPTALSKDPAEAGRLERN